MSVSELVRASQAWIRHMKACPACLEVAKEYGAGERCAEGQSLRDTFLSLKNPFPGLREG